MKAKGELLEGLVMKSWIQGFKRCHTFREIAAGKG